ncbi:MAG: O-antigen ligase family protein [Hydrogenophaga sp.]|uniref:O-antigen ligase family protein n=1 Tax=Hydrogenophaga sp. TaxID=1904254 RepID=UPI0025BEA221|nr:O-antigen ligase family protein [Hydrogenophaga sp.]MBT9550650.1 O-antigen ligase family protein [Hydrogenophaga sp.]
MMQQTIVPVNASLPRHFSIWVNSYISALATCVLTTAYLDIAGYISSLTNGAFLPKYAYFSLGAATVPLLVLRRKVLWLYLGSHHSMCVAAMALMNLVHWLVHSYDGHGEAAALTMTRIQYLILATLLGFVLIQARPALLGRVFVFLSLLLTVLQVVDFMFPGMIVLEGTKGVVEGRASSTLLNANKAAESLILLTLFGIPILRPAWRIWLLLLVFPGILLSFSRSGLIVWTLIVTVGLWLRIFPRKTFFLLLCVASLAISSAVSLPDLLLPLVDLSAADNVYHRLMFFSSFDTSDFSSQQRIDVLQYSIENFLTQPILGHGSGFTHLWGSFQESTHNQHMLILGEYGIFGYSLFVWLLFLIYHSDGYFKSQQLPQLQLLALGVALAFTLFTHNMFDHLYWLVSLVLISHSMPHPRK